MDGFSEAGIRVESDNVNVDVEDCHFRNFIYSTSFFGGQPFMINYNVPGKIIFRNNTFFACNSFLFSVRLPGPEDAIFEHNTIVYAVVNPFIIGLSDNVFIKNNLFYGSHAWGGDPNQIMSYWFMNYPDSISSGIYHVLTDNKWGPFDVDGPEVINRTHEVLNNNIYYPDALIDFYDNWNDTVTVADTVTFPSGYKDLVVRKLSLSRWMNDYTIATVNEITNPDCTNYSPNFVVANNMALDPQFEDADVVAHIDELIGYVNGIASHTWDELEPWSYELNFPPKWPIPKNLSYSNATL